ncbi:MAG TPA: hypothetical protein DEP05_06350 [Betaproteobacteria bacterium]|nr:hypothetical protein [Betaproteobacteria bacterium]
MTKRGAVGTIVVTGANGFVGYALCSFLHSAGHDVRRVVRDLAAESGADGAAIGETGPDTDWRVVLEGVDVVVHLAARAHVIRDEASDPLGAFRAVNVTGTATLARAAARVGVRRLIYLSSVKVNGEYTGRAPFRESDTPVPKDAYGLSKYEAEQVLWQIAAETGLEVTILRPPLVYGPGVKANFLRLLQWVDGGFPLPLASVKNQRSLLYVGNLVDAIVTCLSHPAAAGQLFLLSDGEDISTPVLIRRLATALARRPHLLPFPPVLLRFAAARVGKEKEGDRLLGSLTVDSTRIRQRLGWNPPYSMAEGLRSTISWFRGMDVSYSEDR